MRRFDITLTGLLFAVPALLISARASAQTCTATSDCDRGFVCEVVSSGDCAAPACDGTDCPQPEPCEIQETRECVPGPCDSDADCGDGLVCMTTRYTQCTDVACPENTQCEPQASSCTEYISSQCTPRWALPCTMDADCGEGFSCVQYEQCSCDGSSGSADGTEPADGVGTEPNCGCSPSGEFYCELQVLPCSTASECPSGFSCEQNPETGVCNGGSSEPGGTSVEPTCEPSTGPENVCFPPYYQYGYAVDIAGEFDRAASGVPTSADGEAASGAEADDVEATGGCTVVPAAGAGSSASLLGLLALVGLAARRRTRRRAT